MSESSPKWKNPADIMKHRTVKRRTLTRRKTIHDPTDLAGVFKRTEVAPLVNKRKNPFGCSSENKRPNVGEDSTTQKIETRNFFKALDDTNERVASELQQENSGNQVKQPTSYREKENSDQLCLEKKISDTENQVFQRLLLKEQSGSDKETLQPVKDKDSSSESFHESLPIDWSIKIKMRIVSEACLAWCTQLKMADEAKAITQHVQGSQQWDAIDEKRSSFHSCCLHWVHPNIPWMRLFPRIVSEQKITNISLVGGNEEATEALHQDWTESFTSVYHLLRAGKCPYFYLCTHQFTVLFRTPGVGQLPQVNASLTPTTRGLREALKAEGISFSMPNLEGKKVDDTSPGKTSLSEKAVTEEVTEGDQADSNKTEMSQASTTCEDEEDDDMIDNDGASVWLESLGLDKKSFPSLDPNKVKIQREGFRRVDNRPESLVYVEGAEVQALFNFLLNCRSCIASSGPQAGIPPTILAPVAFKGATLKPNKLKHSVAKQTDNAGNIKKGHVIEMSGPILPHHLLNISNILREIQNEDFTLTFNTHGPTSPLNLRNNPTTQVGSSKEVHNTGLHPLSLRTMSGQDSLVDNRFYKEVTSTLQGFHFEL